MPDNNQIPGPHDARRINIHEDHELQYWSKELNVSKQKLVDAVTAVGTSVEAVKRKLQR